MSTNFKPTTAEYNLVNQIFAQNDPQKLGILTGDVAVRVFGGAKLPGAVLGEIWNLVDEENNGWLSRKGVTMALRLMGHAQKGEKVSAALLDKPGPLPSIEGYSSIAQQNTGMSIPKSPPPGFPPLSAQDKIKFQNLFNRSGPVNGLLSGDKARNIFLKSKLSNEQLLQIWNLADTRDRGALDLADFTIAMYFIQGLIGHQISFIPPTLPPGLYEQAGGSSASTAPVVPQFTGSSGSFSPIRGTFANKNVQPQYTGQSQSLPPSLPARPNITATRSNNTLGQNDSQWDITPVEKAEADSFFEGLDTRKLGYIEGEVAVPFMLKSQLPGEELAQIWDLADLENNGRLTRDGFAIAMHLIKKRLAGQPLPQRLPSSLIPPSMRGPFASPFQSAPASQPEVIQDLLSLDETPPASAVSPQTTGTLNTLQPQSTGATAVPTTTARVAPADPFASSPFGGTSHHDLLGDDEHAQTSSPMQDQSAEIGNVKNQLQSTNKSLDNAKAERATMESKLANQAAELSSLQTQLSSAKAMYDTETRVLSQLKERFAAQATEIQQTREQLIRAESDLSALRVEKAEVEQALLRDKEESRDLHKRMIEAGQQADQLRLEVEKAKKEAKQQKGRLAIARKQLSTKETEKAKVEKELEEATAEVKSVIQEAEEVEAQLNKLSEAQTTSDPVAFAAAHPLPVSPEPVAPGKSNNPFERLAKSSTPSSPSFLTSNNMPGAFNIGPADTQTQTEEHSFDDLFGVADNKPTEEQAEQLADSTQETVNDPPATDQPAKSEQLDLKDAVEHGNQMSTPMTAETERFVTPPTSVNNGSPADSPNPAMDAQTKFPDVDDIATQFPPLENVSTKAPEDKHDDQEGATDLGANLKELDIEEPDSDSDDEPLAEVAQKQKEKANAQLTETKALEASAPVTDPTPTRSSFDDMFGAPSNNVTASVQPPDTSKQSSSPFDLLSEDKQSEAPKTNGTAGANAFDETLTGLSPTAPTDNTQITFDFDDKFDFVAAGGTQPPLAPFTATGPAESNPSSTNDQQPQTFDDIFFGSSMSQPQLQPLPQAVSSSPATNGVIKEPAKPTFSDTFANFESGPDLNLDTSYTSNGATKMDPPDQTSLSRPFPTSPPTSPKASDAASPRPSTNRSMSPPPITVSPPARGSSPKPRPSTSFGDGREKLKEPPRHSKLSIRLPFGKKKKQQEHAPPPPSRLSPPKEEVHRTTTPASDDDVEAVKQITAMGFSRSQAVEALEKYGYNLPQAINSLLQ